MITRGARAVPVVVAAAIIGIALHKGHSTPSKGSVAFVHHEPGIRIMVSGNVNKPGVYKVSSPDVANIVNMLTVAGAGPNFNLSGVNCSSLNDGTVIHFSLDLEGKQIVTQTSMHLRERVYFGIPVDLNALSVQEWEWLPEIGPRLAVELVADRQRNGGFDGYNDLERVPGIGETRVKRIKTFILRKN